MYSLHPLPAPPPDLFMLPSLFCYQHYHIFVKFSCFWPWFTLYGIGVIYIPSCVRRHLKTHLLLLCFYKYYRKSIILFHSESSFLGSASLGLMLRIVGEVKIQVLSLNYPFLWTFLSNLSASRVDATTKTYFWCIQFSCLQLLYVSHSHIWHGFLKKFLKQFHSSILVSLQSIP